MGRPDRAVAVQRGQSEREFYLIQHSRRPMLMSLDRLPLPAVPLRRRAESWVQILGHSFIDI